MNPLEALLSGLGQGVGATVSPSLPSTQDVATAYIGAVVTFWVVGGVTLYVMYQLIKK